MFLWKPFRSGDTEKSDNAVLNDHEYGCRLGAIGRSNDEIGPKVFREYFRVDPSILKV